MKRMNRRDFLSYAVPANINILIENHAGVSNDADWFVSLMKEVNSKYFGVLPDWRQPGGKIYKRVKKC